MFFNKWLYIGGLITILSIYTVWLKIDNMDLSSENTRIEKENKYLVSLIDKAKEEINLKENTIIGLNKKTDTIEKSKNDELTIWIQKYNFCIQEKENSVLVDKDGKTEEKQEVLNEKSSKFYIDLYNNNIFK